MSWFHHSTKAGQPLSWFANFSDGYCPFQIGKYAIMRAFQIPRFSAKRTIWGLSDMWSHVKTALRWCCLIPARIRWLATVVVILAVDACTILALGRGGGPQLITHQDKALHVAAFFVLFVLGYLSLSFDFFPRKKAFSYRILMLNGLIWGSYGLCIEVLQYGLGYRSGSTADLAADFLGMTLGAIWIRMFSLHPTAITPETTEANA